MMKKWRAQEEKERGQMPELKLAAKQELSVVTYNLLGISSTSVATQKVIRIDLTIGFPIDRANAIFHPPALSA